MGRGYDPHPNRKGKAPALSSLGLPDRYFPKTDKIATNVPVALPPIEVIDQEYDFRQRYLAVVIDIPPLRRIGGGSKFVKIIYQVSDVSDVPHGEFSRRR